jgi:hypothetical protein
MAETPETPEPVNSPVNDTPKSPAIVKRTAMKPPKEAPTEKQIRVLQESQARLEDRMDGFEGALQGVNEFIEKAFPGGSHGSGSHGRAQPSAMDEFDQDIFRTD